MAKIKSPSWAMETSGLTAEFYKKSDRFVVRETAKQDNLSILQNPQGEVLLSINPDGTLLISDKIDKNSNGAEFLDWLSLYLVFNNRRHLDSLAANMVAVTALETGNNELKAEAIERINQLLNRKKDEI